VVECSLGISSVGGGDARVEVGPARQLGGRSLSGDPQSSLQLLGALLEASCGIKSLASQKRENSIGAEGQDVRSKLRVVGDELQSVVRDGEGAAEPPHKVVSVGQENGPRRVCPRLSQ